MTRRSHKANALAIATTDDGHRWADGPLRERCAKLIEELPDGYGFATLARDIASRHIPVPLRSQDRHIRPSPGGAQRLLGQRAGVPGASAKEKWVEECRPTLVCDYTWVWAEIFSKFCGT